MFTCDFPFPTPALPPRAQPRAHPFDENHLISGRTPLIFDRKVSQARKIGNIRGKER